MTAQFSETLLYKGEKLTKCAEPLGPFLESAASTLKFHVDFTALWRSYIGTWSIEHG